MRFHRKILTTSVTLVLAVATICASNQSARANVYATNVKLNGAFDSITNTVSGPVTISYLLNEPATLGVTVAILSGNNAVRSLNIAAGAPGSLAGTNSVTWDGNNGAGNPIASGTYTIAITAAASGFTNWTQTSTDTNAGYYVFSPRGLAVNTNPQSIYYGRVFVGNATGNPAGSRPGDTNGILKANADGSLADEGQSDGGFAFDSDGFNGNPHFLRYGQDDRIYALDWDGPGIIVAFDMAMTTNQLVLTENNYASNPFNGLVTTSAGWGVFDVTDAGTAHGRLWLGNNDINGAGIWTWHMTNGIADPNDTTGTQVIAVGGDLNVAPDGGFMMDSKSNIFVGQDISTQGDSSARALFFTNWNGVTTLTNGTAWQAGASDDTFLGNFDLALDSRVNPKYVAFCLGISGGLRVLDAATGAIVTNGDQILDNLDGDNLYYGVAWDAVGNLYGASSSTNLWRVFSPPGTNQVTTVAVETVSVLTSPTLLQITNLTLNGTVVSLKFTSAASDSPTNFTVQSTAALGIPFVDVTGASIVQSGAPGSFVATTTNAAAGQFYRIKR